MKFAVSVDDRTYSMTVPWWLLAVMLLVGLLWQPATVWASDGFTDVPDSNVFHDDIDWMADAGVTAGCNPPANDEFCPDGNVTREQMAAFIRRLETKGVFMRADEVASRLSALESDVATLQSENSALESDVATLQSENSGLESDVATLESLLAGVSRTQVDGHDTLRLEAMNVQVVNGAGGTASTNGLGNLIVGYHEDHTTGDCFPSSDCQYFGDAGADDRSGSHNLIVGVDHSYTSYGGLLAGLNSTTSGIFASVSGGRTNAASGSFASVSGGRQNVASGSNASVSGGTGNEASSAYASVSGGNGNVASGANSSSVSGGDGNVASGFASSILGGNDQTVSTARACHPGC